MTNVLKDIFRSLKYPNFRLFFAGQSISLIGTWIQRLALPWLVYHLTNSVVLLGVVGFCGQIPTFLLSSFAGVLTDRWNRYYILIGTQILSMLQALTLAALYYSGNIQIWHIIVLNILIGCINAFDVPSRQSLLIDLVERKEDLSNAIALNSSMVNGARLLGPSVAGVLIALTGEGVCFLINGLSYIVVIASLLCMKITPRQKTTKNKNVFKELKEGFNYTFGFIPIRYIILLLALVSLTGMPYTVLMPVFAKEIFHSGAHTFGFLIGASGFGALTAAIFLASRKNIAGFEKIISLSSGLFGIALILFGLSRILPLSLALSALIGIGMMLQMASSNTVIQSIVEDDKRGRVMSFYTMAFLGMAPFGSIIAGSLAKEIGAPNTLILGGVACLCGAIVFIAKRKVIREAISKHLSN